MSFHSKQTANHPIQNYTFLNEAERLAATGFTSEDIGKVARQINDGSFFVLSTTLPLWTDITATILAESLLLSPAVTLLDESFPGSIYTIDGYDVVGGRPQVVLSNAGNEMGNMRPAFGVADVASGPLPASMKLLIVGEVSGLDTSSFSVGTKLFLSKVSGEFTKISPDEYSQEIAFVTFQDISDCRAFFN